MTKQLTQPNSLVARNIMTERIRSFSPVTPIPQAIHELLQRRVSEMPIVNGVGEYCGMFSEKCCMRVLSTLVELVGESAQRRAKASDAMTPLKTLFTLSPELDVHVAMASLLQRGYSGAPVIDSDRRLLGIFSERTCMGYVIEAAYNRLPAAPVREFIDPASNRLIDGDTDLHTIARLFMVVPYGSVPVMRDNEIAGQLSRRDVLQHSGVLASIMAHHLDESENERGSHAVEQQAYVRAHDTLPDHTVRAFADKSAQTISPEMNLFSIARLFLVSSFRRFPVLEDERLVGQISRCDLLRAVLALPA